MCTNLLPGIILIMLFALHKKKKLMPRGLKQGEKWKETETKLILLRLLNPHVLTVHVGQIDQIDHLSDPNLPLWDLVQDLYSTDPSQ